MVLMYRYIFQYGDNKHCITAYENWTRDEGASGKMWEDSDSNFQRLYSRTWKKIPKSARNDIKEIASRNIQTTIIDENGKTLERYL